MKIKKLIKLLKQYNKNRSVKLQTSTCIEDILNVDQSYDADYDEVYLTGNLDNGITYVHRYDDDKALQHSVSQTNQIFKLEQEVSRLRERNKILQERMEDLYRRLEKKSWKEVNAPRYMFSEIPNNNYGKAFVDAVKQYLNKSRYSTRVRGQHVKEEYKGTGVTEHGQTIDQSTHLRIYIEEKE